MEPGTRMPRFVQRLADSLYTRAGGQSSDARNATSHMSFPTVAPPVLYERGGNGQTCEERLYVQLHVLDANSSANLPGAREKLKKQLETRDVSSVVYDDVNNPRSIGLLTWSTDPSHFVKVVNPILQMVGIGDVLTPRPRWTMFGKTYANGHEPSLVDFLIEKVPRNATRADAPYAVWYPMRRSGDFYMQSPEDQCRMLLHHAAIGKAFAEVGAAYDIRLNCYGIDADDNEFVVGLVGKDLHGLSKVVQEMRKTEHTSYYLKSLGPFFVGMRVFSHRSRSETTAA
ncbi:hypothetical protein Pmar_PMAR004333 [Perkinsus marinus ATCC 50983]|uniref:Chlorite dismutase n=1 Tax=Perkinsus marinus (strain ATCC 50983 / TXsc) TaxID=423536 RepID=C5LWV2_PERM5|nr:hypothetical protein Pmar_PMAR004333 [Perkinsus marinus ATCC 50983]EEQ98791.1 hypothetical protein Pmar_PMAR004333 [Perkinsus marinus ATCC 50983]|eukprot:XP_002766074.1 hypothetical protein Pmar_PMAR004333 [Perkinsus marinus ATCC 50983]